MSDFKDKSMFFSSEQAEQLTKDFEKVIVTHTSLLEQFMKAPLKNREATEYLYFGFLRRLGVLRHCIETVYTICPPERVNILTMEECQNTTIALQSFVINIFGCLDNLAWIWVKEKNIQKEDGKPIPPLNIGLMNPKKNREVRNSFSSDFVGYLSSLKKVHKRDPDKWYDNLESYRHSLAHRTPLYVIPYGVSRENLDEHNALEFQKQQSVLGSPKYSLLDRKQDNLGHYAPIMSYTEESNRVCFNAQILADWNTIIKISEMFLEELSKNS